MLSPFRKPWHMLFSRLNGGFTWPLSLQFLTGTSYEQWADTLGLFHQHFLQHNVTPVYEEHWNEPDMTEYLSYARRGCPFQILLMNAFQELQHNLEMLL